MACENFRCLCTGEKSKHLHFKGINFYRKTDKWIKSPNHCYSIYGKDKFEKDKSELKPSKKGDVYMGFYDVRRQYSSMFMINLSDHYDRNYQKIGEVVKGMEVLEKIK